MTGIVGEFIMIVSHSGTNDGEAYQEYKSQKAETRLGTTTAVVSPIP